MAIDRRVMLGGLGALALASGRRTSAQSGTTASKPDVPLFLAARMTRDGRFSAAVLEISAGVLHTVPLPARGHGFAVRPSTRDCVVFARRPGTFALHFNADGRRRAITFNAPADRHFYGHGVFSADGRLLYCTENDFERARGVIGIYDAEAGYRRAGEFDSGGIGPHDLALLPDLRTLVVANGGVATHPASGRLPLNLPTMRSNLAYLDVRHGEVLETYALPGELQPVSIRHLAVARHGQIVVGCQVKAARGRVLPLVGLHRRGEALAALALPEATWRDMRGYVGSICTDRSGRFAAASCPRAGICVMIDLDSRSLMARHRMPLVNGLAQGRDTGRFLMTSGRGRYREVSALSQNGDQVGHGEATTLAWDNHCLALPAA